MSLRGIQPTTSVTRFGEISPLWQKFSRLWQIVDGLFFIWQNVDPILLICYIIGLISLLQMAKY